LKANGGGPNFSASLQNKPEAAILDVFALLFFWDAECFAETVSVCLLWMKSYLPVCSASKVNPVRNSSGALNPAGIILKSNPAAEQRGFISNGVKP